MCNTIYMTNKNYFLLFLIYFIIQGCNVVEDEFEKSNFTQIEDVKNWFNKQSLQANHNSKINEMVVLSPNWDEFKIHKLEDGREVIEISNKKGKDILRTKGDNEEKLKMMQTSILFFPIENESFEMYTLATFQQEKVKSSEKLEELNYLLTPKDFTGERLFFDSENKFLGGWSYVDGVISKTIRQSKNKSNINKRLNGTIYYTCEYEIITWWQEQAGPDLYLGTDYTMSCEFEYVEDEDYPTGTPVGGGGSLPGNDGPNPPQEEENCYEQHPTIPDLWVLCGFLIADNCFEGMPCYNWGNEFGNCTEIGNVHGGAVTLDQFEDYYEGIDYNDIVSDMPDKSITGFGSQPGGPLTSYRYVYDPLNPNLVIDMRHMLVIGKYGRAVGESVEVLQWLANQESAFDSQDFFSNELGYLFFKKFGGAIQSTPEYTTDYLRQFLNNASLRNDICTPLQCDWY